MADPAPQERARTLVVAALAPLVTSYAVLAALFALISVATTHAGFSAVDTLLAAGPGLLAVYQVPLTIGGAPLGVLPLLPTIGVCVLVARTASGAAQRLGYREPGQALVIVGLIAGTHGLAGALIALAASGAPLHVTPVPALLIAAVVSGVAALAGVARPCGITAAVRGRLHPVAAQGLRAGGLALATLLLAGSVTFAFATLLALPEAHRLFASAAPGFGGELGMWLLSVAYLPNAMAAGTGMALGPGFSLGTVAASPFGYDGGAVLGVPLLAGVPESYSTWWLLWPVLAVASGVLVGFSARHTAEQPFVRLRVVLIAGVLAALGMVVLATLAGGELGSGALSPVEIPPGLSSLAAFGWIVVPGGIVSWFAGPHPRLRGVRPVGRVPADGEHGSADAEHGSTDAEHGTADVEDGSADAEHGTADGEHDCVNGEDSSVSVEDSDGASVGRTARSDDGATQ